MTLESVPSYRPGSVEDFDRLYRDSYRNVLCTLIGVLGDVAAAEDCAQDTFVRAFEAWPRWRPEAHAEAWLHRIAMRIAFSHRRRERVRSVAGVIRRLGRPDSGAGMDERDDEDAFLGALRCLTPSQAAAVVLRYHHGYSNREIAAALDISESTVGSRLAKARERLREELGAGRTDRLLPTAQPSCLSA